MTNSRTGFGWGTLIVIGVISVLATNAYHRHYALPGPADASGEMVMRDAPSVVISIRDLAALEATSYHIERVVDLRDKQTRLFGLVQGEDAILLVAAGDVVAGVDLGSMRDEDIQVDPVNRSVRVLLPPVSVLSAKLDSQRTYLHTRKTDVFAKRSETLESRARVEAENTLREAALNAGILQRARQSTRASLETLLRSLNFKQVEVRFREE